ncbi:hypothetical protein C4F49_02280 [Sphingobacterium sp. KB22]|uniref:Transposase n=1 Tax=Sphingobacterium hungaricum TaxID=2082723 RepID=A0A928UTL8_9SPHI|nr:hypothetical protein [Sphingobacterium hungaricum]
MVQATRYKRPQKFYSLSQKANAVERVIGGGEMINDVANDVGCSHGIFSDWLKKYFRPNSPFIITKQSKINYESNGNI